MQETGQQMRGNVDALLKPIREHQQSLATPVGRRHPRTGTTVLFVSEMNTAAIDGLPEDESEAVIEELFAHLYDPTRAYTHRWQQGDLVLWDNLALQHARPNVTLDGPARTLRKVIAPDITGPRPETPKFDVPR